MSFSTTVEAMPPQGSAASSDLSGPEEKTLKGLAGLSLVEYDRRRSSAADELGVRVQTLDKEVEKRRVGRELQQGRAMDLSETEPWAHEVDGVDLFHDLVQTFGRFLALRDYAAEAMALWALFAHGHDAFQISPILAFVSPEKRCGKTTALSVLSKMVPRGLATSNITVSALFRAVEKWRPTLIVDEADTFISDNDDLRGILNSGHNRAQAWVIRSVGDDHEPRQFGTWAPKAVALIGSLPETLDDRSVIVSMCRRKPDEAIERFRSDRDLGLHDLNRRCARWIVDHWEELEAADPSVPKPLHDRAADNWRALLAVADVIGGEVPSRARTAAVALTPGEEVSLGVELLSDIRGVFTAKGCDRIKSYDLCEVLCGLPARPWAEIGRAGKAMTQRGLASRLRPFGVKPESVRFDHGTAKGYRLAEFAECFDRYLPEKQQAPHALCGTPEQTNNSEALAGSASGTSEPTVPDQAADNPVETQDCSAVPDPHGEHETWEKIPFAPPPEGDWF